MIDTKEFFAAARRTGIEFFVGVPDSLLKEFCAFASDNVASENHVIAPNEGCAMGLAIGYNLASGKVPLIYSQNSGLGNLVNPLLSLAARQVYRIPAILLIGWRGEPGVADEPQHKAQGELMIGMLESMKVPHFMLSENTAESCSILASAHAKAVGDSAPVALVAGKGLFSPYSRLSSVSYPNGIKRIDAMKSVVNAMPAQTAFVATTGFTSRELFALREDAGVGHERDFLTIGGMGHASSIARGLALGGWNGVTCCLDGDGAFLMHMGAAALVGAKQSGKFLHVVFNNGMHESVGGQPTIAPDIDLLGIAHSVGYRSHYRVTTSGELDAILKALNFLDSPVFLEIRCSPSDRENLGRPTRTPPEMKESFMAFLARR